MLQNFTVLKEHDEHISGDELRSIIPAKRVFAVYQKDDFTGWLIFSAFWANRKLDCRTGEVRII